MTHRPMSALVGCVSVMSALTLFSFMGCVCPSDDEFTAAIESHLRPVSVAKGVSVAASGYYLGCGHWPTSITELRDYGNNQARGELAEIALEALQSEDFEDFMSRIVFAETDDGSLTISVSPADSASTEDPVVVCLSPPKKNN